jgi:hypothetical protein
MFEHLHFGVLVVWCRIAGLLIFFSLFMAYVWRVMKMPRSQTERMAVLPLEEGEISKPTLTFHEKQ